MKNVLSGICLMTCTVVGAMEPESAIIPGASYVHTMGERDNPCAAYYTCDGDLLKIVKAPDSERMMAALDPDAQKPWAHSYVVSSVTFPLAIHIRFSGRHITTVPTQSSLRDIVTFYNQYGRVITTCPFEQDGNLILYNQVYYPLAALLSRDIANFPVDLTVSEER